jgi:hypothetical protein
VGVRGSTNDVARLALSGMRRCSLWRHRCADELAQTIPQRRSACDRVVNRRGKARRMRVDRG